MKFNQPEKKSDFYYL